MKNYSLLEKRRVTLENNEEVDLKYYLVDSKRCDFSNECIQGENTNDEGDIVYGVKLVKENIKDNDVEEDEVVGVTFSENDAKKLISILAQNTVTPVSLVDVVDDWCACL